MPHAIWSQTPHAHLVRIVASVLLHRGGRAAVGIAFAQHRVDDAAEHLAVAGLDLLLGFRRRIVWIIRNVVALALQLLDRGLQLRDRGGDVGQLDDVGLGPQCELAEFGEFVVDPLRGRQLLREICDDATGERDVLQLHGHARCAHESLDDRQLGIGRERRGFIDLCPHDFEIGMLAPLVAGLVWADRKLNIGGRGGMGSPAGPQMSCSRRAPYSIRTRLVKALSAGAR